MKYELIIFDCDGVLVDSEPISCGVIAEELTLLGFPMTMEESIHAFAGTSLSYVMEYIETKIGRSIPFDFRKKYRTRTTEGFKDRLQPVPYIKEALTQIDTLKCVASNGPKNKMEMNLELTGLTSFFSNDLFSAYDIQKWKPDPALFLHAAKSMGIDPANCVVIEDSIAGVKAAIAADMKVYGYAGETNDGKLKAAGADILFSMKDLPNKLI